MDGIALMPCNPNSDIGKEVDALSGESGKVIDQTFIDQISQRAGSTFVETLVMLQITARHVRMVLKSGKSRRNQQAEADEHAAKDRKNWWVNYSGSCNAAVNGWNMLKARLLFIEKWSETGPNGLLQAATYLTDWKTGIEILSALKQGTPVSDKNSIDFSDGGTIRW